MLKICCNRMPISLYTYFNGVVVELRQYYVVPKIVHLHLEVRRCAARLLHQFYHVGKNEWNVHPARGRHHQEVAHDWGGQDLLVVVQQFGAFNEVYFKYK
jgi:hypothetical protein